MTVIGKTATKFRVLDRVKLVKVPDPTPGVPSISKRYLGSLGTVVLVVEGGGFYHVDLGYGRPIFVAEDSMLEAAA
jgi:hypothetical protein